VAAIAKAVALYPRKGAIVLMVVQPAEMNIADQRGIEFELWNKYGIAVIRRTLAQINESASIDQVTWDLVIDKSIIAVTYFRAGYTPKDYPSNKEWTALLSIERSRSIKCPTIGYHLSGSKKIQQVLARPENLSRFMNKQQATRLSKCFTGLWGLENKDQLTQQMIAKAIDNPAEYVLKPQREGGGNNKWGEEIVSVLNSQACQYDNDIYA